MDRVRASLWVEIVGVVAIIVSLGLVAVEIRQNTDAISAQAVLALNDGINETNLLVTSDVGFAELLMRADAAGERGLTSTEIARLERWTMARANVYESAYEFHRKGILDSNRYASCHEATCAMATHPGEGAVLSKWKPFYDPDFVGYLESTCKRQ